MSPLPPHFDDPPHPATLSDEALLRRCTVTFGRTGGPGGQHRNKVETAVTLEHDPTGVRASAAEARKQFDNRRVAVWRLRMRLALEFRREIDLRRYRASELWQSRRQGRMLSINPRHRDYPALLSEALDVIAAMRADVAGAAGVLGVSMSQLARLLRHDKAAMALVNRHRTEIGLHPLK